MAIPFRASTMPTAIWEAMTIMTTRMLVVSTTSTSGKTPSKSGSAYFYVISEQFPILMFDCIPLYRNRKSQLRSKQFLMDDPKYKGKKSSRKTALGFDSEDDEDEDEEEMEFDEDEDEEDEDEKDQDEEMVSDEDDLDDGEDLLSRFDRDGSDDENENDEDDDEENDDEDDEENSQDDDDDEEDSDGEDEEDGYGDLTASGITETSKEMQEELQKIQQEESELLKSMTKSVTDDVEKGIHVKAQMVRQYWL